MSKPQTAEPGAVPEQVYLDAGRAQQIAWRPDEDPQYQQRIAERMAADPPFRAAVESAYWAGYGQGRDDEAAGLDLPHS